MDRIKSLCSYLENCTVFADVACDHGYCAQYMLKNGLCEKCIISDVSDKSLDKARGLLSSYISAGRCTAICCDGLEKIEGADLVLIAGIGGEEIIKILKNSYIPENFVFQPMKNARELRAYLIEKGCEITRDDIFSDGRNYYFVIKGKAFGKSPTYGAYELAFGRDSLKNAVLNGYLTAELSKKQSYLSAQMSVKARAELEAEVKFIREVLENETDGNT